MSNIENLIPSNVTNHFFTSIQKYNEFATITSSSSNRLKILQINPCSIESMNKFDSFCEFLDSMSSDIDIIVVSDTWIKPGTTGIYKIPGYLGHYAYRDGKGGGLAVFIREGLGHQCIEIIKSDFFSIMIEVKISMGILCILSYYRPPYILLILILFLNTLREYSLAM